MGMSPAREWRLVDARCTSGCLVASVQRFTWKNASPAMSELPTAKRCCVCTSLVKSFHSSVSDNILEDVCYVFECEPRDLDGRGWCNSCHYKYWSSYKTGKTVHFNFDVLRQTKRHVGRPAKKRRASAPLPRIPRPPPVRRARSSFVGPNFGRASSPDPARLSHEVVDVQHVVLTRRQISRSPLELDDICASADQFMNTTKSAELFPWSARQWFKDTLSKQVCPRCSPQRYMAVCRPHKRGMQFRALLWCTQCNLTSTYLSSPNIDGPTSQPALNVTTSLSLMETGTSVTVVSRMAELLDMNVASRRTLYYSQKQSSHWIVSAAHQSEMKVGVLSSLLVLYDT